MHKVLSDSSAVAEFALRLNDAWQPQSSDGVFVTKLRITQVVALLLSLIGTGIGVISGLLDSKWSGAATDGALVAVILASLLLRLGDQSTRPVSESRFVIVGVLLVLALGACVAAFLSTADFLAQLGLSLIGVAVLAVLTGAMISRRRSRA